MHKKFCQNPFRNKDSSSNANPPTILQLCETLKLVKNVLSPVFTEKTADYPIVITTATITISQNQFFFSFHNIIFPKIIGNETITKHVYTM